MLFRYWRWKRMAGKAIAENRIAECIDCDDPIVPGDFVAVESSCSDVSHQHLVHAGFHFTLNNRNAFCETGAVGIGYWDGIQVINCGESLAAKALRTGEP